MEMMKSKSYTLQEVLNLYPARAPQYPHLSTIASDWFTKMLEDAGLNLTITALDSEITQAIIKDIVNALATTIYNRHSEDYIYEVVTPWNVNHTLEQSEFKKAMKDLLCVMELTIPKYIPMFIQFKNHSKNPIDQIHSSSIGKTRFNDTPQDPGEYDDDDHATNVSNSYSESSVDSGSIMERLESMFKNFKSIILDWSNEFNMVFLKEEQL